MTKAPPTDRKKLVYIGVIVACLAAGALAYFLQTGNGVPAAEKGKVEQAEQKAAEMQRQMQKTAPKVPEAPAQQFEPNAGRKSHPFPSK
jgi:hypothetical protein